MVSKQRAFKNNSGNILLVKKRVRSSSIRLVSIGERIIGNDKCNMNVVYVFIILNNPVELVDLYLSLL